MRYYARRGCMPAVTDREGKTMTGPTKAQLDAMVKGKLPFNQQIKDAAQGRIKQNLFASGQTSKDQLDAFGKEIEKKFGYVKYIPGPLKTEESASRKLGSDYGGDWYQLKDLARCTVVAPQQYLYPAPGDLRQIDVIGFIYQYFNPSKTTNQIDPVTGKPMLNPVTKNPVQVNAGLNVISAKETKPASNPCGYSGFTCFVRTGPGYAAETQINCPEVIFAKTKPSTFKKLLGGQTYMRLFLDFQVEGGLGHALYEIWREPKGRFEAAEAAAKLSTEYYEYFRRRPPNMQVRQSLNSRLFIMKRDFPDYFKDH